MSIDPQRLLRDLFASAIDAAHPRQVWQIISPQTAAAASSSLVPAKAAGRQPK